jgi:hypothetical protein
MWRIPTDTPQTAVSNGHTKLPEVTPQTPLDEVFARWDEDGAIIIKGLLTPAQVERLNEEIAPALEETPRGSHIEAIQPFHGRRTKRLGGLANHSEVFRTHLLDNDCVHAICARNYRRGGNNGDYWLSTGTTLTAGGPQAAQPLHRDLNHHVPAVLLGPDFEDVHITFVVALGPFTEANGATRIIPGSHKWPFDQRGRPDQTVGAVMDAGDCLLMSGKVVHGMGENSTTEDRKALQLDTCAGYFTPSEAHSHIVTLENARKLSRRAQRFLGFRSQWTRGSPGLWTKDYRDISMHLGLDDMEGSMQDLQELQIDYAD